MPQQRHGVREAGGGALAGGIGRRVRQPQRAGGRQAHERGGGDGGARECEPARKEGQEGTGQGARDELRGEGERHGVAHVLRAEVALDGHDAGHALQGIERAHHGRAEQHAPGAEGGSEEQHGAAASARHVGCEQQGARPHARGHVVELEGQQHRHHQGRDEHEFGHQQAAQRVVRVLGEVEVDEHARRDGGQVDGPQQRRQAWGTHRKALLMRARARGSARPAGARIPRRSGAVPRR